MYGGTVLCGLSGLACENGSASTSHRVLCSVGSLEHAEQRHTSCPGQVTMRANVSRRARLEDKAIVFLIARLAVVAGLIGILRSLLGAGANHAGAHMRAKHLVPVPL